MKKVLKKKRNKMSINKKRGYKNEFPWQFEVGQNYLKWALFPKSNPRKKKPRRCSNLAEPETSLYINKKNLKQRFVPLTNTRVYREAKRRSRSSNSWNC